MNTNLFGDFISSPWRAVSGLENRLRSMQRQDRVRGWGRRQPGERALFPRGLPPSSSSLPGYSTHTPLSHVGTTKPAGTQPPAIRDASDWATSKSRLTNLVYTVLFNHSLSRIITTEQQEGQRHLRDQWPPPPGLSSGRARRMTVESAVARYRLTEPGRARRNSRDKVAGMGPPPLASSRALPSPWANFPGARPLPLRRRNGRQTGHGGGSPAVPCQFAGFAPRPLPSAPPDPGAARPPALP